MITSQNRFHGHNSLNAVYRKGRSVTVSQVSLKFLPARAGKDYRLAVVVSRKVDKSAVVRNRIRRRLYEAMRLKMPTLKERGDIVINVYTKQIASIGAADINELIDQLLTKAGLLEAHSTPDHAIVDKQGN